MISNIANIKCKPKLANNKNYNFSYYFYSTSQALTKAINFT